MAGRGRPKAWGGVSAAGYLAGEPSPETRSSFKDAQGANSFSRLREERRGAGLHPHRGVQCPRRRA